MWLKAVFHKFYLVHSWILCPISLSKVISNSILPRFGMEIIRNLRCHITSRMVNGRNIRFFKNFSNGNILNDANFGVCSI